jgi:hypothetical protein
MTRFLLLAAVATLAVSSVSAEARDRWRHRSFDPWFDRPVYFNDDDEEDVSYYEPDVVEEEEVYIPVRRRTREQRMRDAEKAIDDRLWWLENNARHKLEQRHKARKKNLARVEPVTKPKVKSAAVSKPKPKKADDVQTASLDRPVVVTKPKAKPVVAKTIGCTAGAAVVTGYGFGAVKPKICTGSTYAYTAARAGKTYEIKLTAASGEITDVKKLD